MTSRIEIFNRALGRIGVDQVIADPNVNNKQGSAYRLWYDYCVDQCLADFPWGFATTIIAAAQTAGDAMPGWQYQYAYPVDCVAARQITDSNGARTVYYSYLNDYWCLPGQFQKLTKRPTPWRVMTAKSGTSDQKVIVTDLPEAYLLYTRRITDPNQFDPGFIDAVSWRIAMEIVPTFVGIPQGAQLAVTLGNQYRNALLTARAQSLNESGADEKPDPPSIAARA